MWTIKAELDWETAGIFQVIDLEDDDGNDLTDLVDQGRHFINMEEASDTKINFGAPDGHRGVKSTRQTFGRKAMTHRIARPAMETASIMLQPGSIEMAERKPRSNYTNRGQYTQESDRNVLGCPTPR